MHCENPFFIDTPRLMTDLRITETDLDEIANLHLPTDIRVPSLSAIKTDTVGDALHIVDPNSSFAVMGVKAASEVAEQPLGQTAINGALNRLHDGLRIREEINPGESTKVAWFSIENGLFRVPKDDILPAAALSDTDNIVRYTEGADLSPNFDPNAEYEDRAVAAIRFPGQPIIVQISPKAEAVRFPQAAVLAAYNSEGGFGKHTAGSQLVEMGIVADKQNPHADLTKHRFDGPMPRQDQMARVIIRALLHLARKS